MLIRLKVNKFLQAEVLNGRSDKHNKIPLTFSHNMRQNIPNCQRVLILKGGGSLGSYEAGYIRHSMKWSLKRIRKEDLKINHF